MKITKVSLIFAFLAVILVGSTPAFCWSNGGFSANPANPDYGTHDWIAQHALDYLPTQEKQYITSNLAVYLLGTELPDNSNKTIGGIGDTTKHHVYYSAAGALVDDASAVRAQSEYDQALSYLKANDYADAAKTAGIMTHYIADVAVFGHVMGASTAWGTEKHHSDYESYVDDRTKSYQSSFDSYLGFDGSLIVVSAYNDTINLAYDTTFGGASQEGCTWMDSHYDWSDSAFSGRCGESLNLAVNAVADALHTLYVESSPSPTVTSTPTPTASASSTSMATASPQQTMSPSPAAPEYPATSLLIAATLTLTAVAVTARKNRKRRL